MTQCGPLGDGRHLHEPERHSDNRAQYQGDRDPRVVDNAAIHQRGDNSEEHAEFPSPNAAACRGRRTHPFEREDEQPRRNQVDHLNRLLGDQRCSVHYFFGLLVLNIFSMRSVIRNPLTRLLVAATMAIVPRTVASPLLCSPARMMAPTTAMASSALVSDISG